MTNAYASNDCLAGMANKKYMDGSGKEMVVSALISKDGKHSFQFFNPTTKKSQDFDLTSLVGLVGNVAGHRISALQEAFDKLAEYGKYMNRNGEELVPSEPILIESRKYHINFSNLTTGKAVAYDLDDLTGLHRVGSGEE